MSDHNNIYQIMGKLNALTPVEQPVVEKKSIYESVEAKGSVLEGVKGVEANLNEKYMGFKKVAAAAKAGGAKDPGAVAASIGRKKYGKAAFQKAAAAGKKMGEDYQSLGRGMEEGHADQQRKIIKRNGKPVGEVGIDRESSPGNGQYYMKCYATGHDQVGYDSMEEALAELKHCLKQGVAEARDGDVNFGHTVTRGSWVVHKDGKLLKRFKTHGGAKAYAERCGGKVASSEYYADNIQKKDVAEERETLKTKGGTIYKGGKYGTEYDADDEGKKKPKAKDGESKGRGRPKKDKPAEYTKSHDLFGRVKDTAHKGVKGTKVKGKGNEDTVDESAATRRDPYQDYREKRVARDMSRGAPEGDARRYQDSLIHGTDKRAKSSYFPKPRPLVNKLATPMDEKAPPGDKYERMVKHAKKNFPKGSGAPYAIAWKAYNKAHGKNESAVKVGKSLLESVNFKKMVDEANMTVDEMLECINGDIQAYKTTGDMTDRLRDFMHLHNHMKSIEEANTSPSFAPQMPSGEQILPSKKPGIVSKALDLAKGPDDAQLLAKLAQDAHKPSVHQELDELAKLAGITDEGNAFSGALASAKAHHDDSFEVDGHEYPVDEDETGPVQMYQESKKTNLEDIARLSGIYQEGKDYGDTTYPESPVYDNTPDEKIQGEDVLLKGGDGEVAGQEKKMSKDGAARFSDNPLAMKEDRALLKPAAEFNYVKEMGRDLMKAYQGIKTK